MPNLIRQITFERPTPQRIDWAVPRDVDPQVATWTAVFYTERNRTIRAPERRRIDHLRYFGDANGGPSVLDEPQFSWPAIIVDQTVRLWAGIFNTERQRTYRTPERRRIDKLRSFGDANPGPSIIDEPSFAWCEKVTEGAAPFDPSIYQGIQDELRALRARESKKIYGAVDEPEFGWLWKDAVEPFITSTIIPAIYETPAQYRTPELGKVKLITEPETDWLVSSLTVAFDPSIYVAAFQELSYRSPDAARNLPLPEPEFIWRDLFDFMRWPAIEQMLTRAYRSSDRQKLSALSITEPWAPGIFEAADNFISLYTPSLWTPKDRAPEARKFKVIYGPDDTPWIYPQTVTVVTLDPALWPAIEEQLHALRTQDRRKIEAWLSEPEFTWQYPVNDARNAILFPGTREPSFRARERNYLEVRKMYLSDFGWLTFNIPAPPAVATGKHNKRKWRRSG